MNKKLFLLIFSLFLCISVKAQNVESKEKEAIKRVVETYLFSEEDEERRQTLYPQAEIFSTNPENTKLQKTPVSAKAKKLPKGAKIVSVQKIIGIDIAENGAFVKVETDLSNGELKIPKHIQFISLLKTNGEWKIAAIIIPTISLPPK